MLNMSPAYDTIGRWQNQEKGLVEVSQVSRYMGTSKTTGHNKSFHLKMNFSRSVMITNRLTHWKDSKTCRMLGPYNLLFSYFIVFFK